MLQVTKIIPGGEALATDESGKKVFLWNALPGETIEEYEIVKKKSHYNRGIATKISDPSPHRVEPQDACYLSTSPWQIMDYDYELKLKQDLVVELFREHGITLSIPPIHTDNNIYHYRNKMEYSLFYDHEQAKIFPAFHQRGSHRKIPITSSSIERPDIFAAATKIIDDLNARHEDARKYQSLLLRCNQKGEVSGGLYENNHPHPKFQNLTDSLLGQEYSYSPNGFFQINLPVYEMALKEIAKHITTNKVLDLYAGVGTIGLSVARNKELTLVECDKYAFAELEKNVKEESDTYFSEHVCRRGKRGVTEARDDGPEGTFREACVGSSSVIQAGSPKAVLAKSEDALSYIAPDQTVILDPPRAGCDAKLLDKLLETKPQKIIYLSCNPATQARDVAILLEAYHIEDVHIFNFFPRTPHIENLIVLSL